MPTEQDYDAALGKLDKPTRVCILFLEQLIVEKFNMVLSLQQPPAPQVNLSKIETTLDSLQKQINGLRPKVEAGYKLALDHPEQEKYLKRLTKKTEEFILEAQSQIRKRYEAGDYPEGERRRLRKTGILDIEKEGK